MPKIILSIINAGRVTALIIMMASPSIVYSNTLTMKAGVYTYMGDFDFKTPQPTVQNIKLTPLESLYGSFLNREFTVNLAKVRHSGELAYTDFQGSSAQSYSSITGFGTLDMRTYFRGNQVGNSIPLASTPFFNRQLIELGVNEPMKTRQVDYGLTSSGHITAPIDEFQLWSNTYVNSACGVTDTCYTAASGSLAAKYVVQIAESVKYNLDTQTFGNRLNLWLRENFSVNAISRKLKEEISKHFIESSERKIIIKGPIMDLQGCGGQGCRASVDFIGTTLFTASPGVLAYDISLSETDDVLKVPLAFTKNNVGSFVDISFDGQSLMRLNGNDYELNELNVFELNVANLKGKRGNLTFNINTSGLESAELFAPESAIVNQNFEFTASILAVPEPESYAMMLTGLGVMGLFARRRKRHA